MKQLLYSRFHTEREHVLFQQSAILVWGNCQVGRVKKKFCSVGQKKTIVLYLWDQSDRQRANYTNNNSGITERHTGSISSIEARIWRIFNFSFFLFLLFLLFESSVVFKVESPGLKTILLLLCCSVLELLFFLSLSLAFFLSVESWTL